MSKFYAVHPDDIEEMKDFLLLKEEMNKISIYNYRYDCLNQQIMAVLEVYGANVDEWDVDCWIDNQKEYTTRLNCIIFHKIIKVAEYNQILPMDSQETADNCVEVLLKQVIANCLTYILNTTTPVVGATPIKLFDEEEF